MIQNQGSLKINIRTANKSRVLWLSSIKKRYNDTLVSQNVYNSIFMKCEYLHVCACVCMCAYICVFVYEFNKKVRKVRESFSHGSFFAITVTDEFKLNFKFLLQSNWQYDNVFHDVLLSWGTFLRRYKSLEFDL